MKIYKIIISLILVLIITGCRSDKDDDAMKIVTSFFPVHSLVEELVGHEVSVIVDGGGDPHDFEPTAKQRVAIAEADLFFYHGAGFEFWFEESMVQDGISVEVSEGIKLLEDLDHDSHGHGGVDPHTWLDPNNAHIILDNIYQALLEFDLENKASYKENYEKISKELDAIILDYEHLNKARNKNMVVDHHAYGYLEKGYNLKQEAIIEGVADGDVSFKQTETAIEQIQDLKVKAIFVDPSYRNDIVETIQKATQVEIYDLYTLEQGIDDFTYLEMLKINYDNLNKGLGLQ